MRSLKNKNIYFICDGNCNTIYSMLGITEDGVNIRAVRNDTIGDVNDLFTLELENFNKMKIKYLNNRIIKKIMGGKILIEDLYTEYFVN